MKGLKIFEITSSCTACGACVSACPKQALTLMGEDKYGFYYPSLYPDKCIECHLCEKVCHVLSDAKGPFTDRRPFMLKAKDKEILKKSSSGGVFSLLAKNIMEKGGLVFGAAYDYEKEQLVEISTDKVGIEQLRKSKYIESYCGTIFTEVEKNLKADREVMFCGTPCQIKGLHYYLLQRKISLEKLLLVQFLCHGVPSNKFFTEQKHEMEKKCRAKITDMDFRSKKYGWRTPYYYYYGKGHSKTVRADSIFYLSAFFKYYMLRDSCYGCTIFDEGFADITIADFWGLFKYAPNNKDNEGISLAIVHNEKGERAIEKISDDMEKEELPLTAIEYTQKPNTRVEAMLKHKREMEKHIEEEGYMPYMERILAKDVRKGRIKDFIAKILFTTGIWKINT